MSDPHATETQTSTLLWCRGQSTLEYVVLIAAVVSALVVMSDYIRRSFNAHGNALEEQLNGAITDNAPGAPAGGGGGDNDGPVIPEP